MAARRPAPPPQRPTAPAPLRAPPPEHASTIRAAAAAFSLAPLVDDLPETSALSFGGVLGQVVDETRDRSIRAAARYTETMSRRNHVEYFVALWSEVRPTTNDGKA